MTTRAPSHLKRRIVRTVEGREPHRKASNVDHKRWMHSSFGIRGGCGSSARLPVKASLHDGASAIRPLWSEHVGLLRVEYFPDTDPRGDGGSAGGRPLLGRCRGNTRLVTETAVQLGPTGGEPGHRAGSYGPHRPPIAEQGAGCRALCPRPCVVSASPPPGYYVRGQSEGWSEWRELRQLCLSSSIHVITAGRVIWFIVSFSNRGRTCVPLPSVRSGIRLVRRSRRVSEFVSGFEWARRDSNSLPPAPEAGALSR